MRNFTKPETITLAEVKARIRSTDLVPSRQSLVESIDHDFEHLDLQGLQTMADLMNALKNPSRLEALSQAAEIDSQKLVLLRREIESYNPKPFKLTEIDWLSRQTILRLIDQGIGNSANLYEITKEEDGVTKLLNSTGIDPEESQILASLADLARVQWVSLNFARMLLAAGIKSSQELALADANQLCLDLERINGGGNFFNGKIGLRDVKRLIHSAGYVN